MESTEAFAEAFDCHFRHHPEHVPLAIGGASATVFCCLLLCAVVRDCRRAGGGGARRYARIVNVGKYQSCMVSKLGLAGTQGWYSQSMAAE